MSAYIDIKAISSNQAAQVRYAIDQLRSVVDNFGHLKAVMDQMASGGDWVALGGYLGVSAAEAEAVYNLWGSANTELNATFITQLLGRCG
jgi:thiamine monophosphate kinase